VRHGFFNLVTIMDRATCKVLSRRQSKTLDARFCLEALEKTIATNGSSRLKSPLDCETGVQGSRFTGSDWGIILADDKIKTPPLTQANMRCRAVDNIFIERRWWPLKQEAVYLHELTDGFVAKRVIRDWIMFCKSERPQTSFEKRPPDDAYFDCNETKKAA